MSPSLIRQGFLINDLAGKEALPVLAPGNPAPEHSVHSEQAQYCIYPVSGLSSVGRMPDLPTGSEAHQHSIRRLLLPLRPPTPTSRAVACVAGPTPTGSA